MDLPFASSWSQYADVFTRWVHVVAGVLWVGQLFFFNFVNAPAQAAFDAETKRKVVPELLPRALYFFRWGALFTWATGLLLIGLVYHLGGLMVPADAGPTQKALAFSLSQVAVWLGFFPYDLLFKMPLRKSPAGAVVGLALFVAVAFGLSRLLSGRALFIHLGAILGTVMMMNVWMRIWPAQKKIIRGVKELDPKPGPEVAELAAERSKHNLFMAVPVLLFMIAPHTFPLAYGDDYNWVFAGVVMAVGWGGAAFLIGCAKSAGPMKAP
jgi:uncharacterized membrane protein